MKRELTPQAMMMLEQQAKANIKKCNEQIRKNTEVYHMKNQNIYKYAKSF